MGRSRPPYGGGYRGTGLKVGRASRRRRRSFWRSYIWTPLVTLILLGAAALAVAVVVDYFQQPAAQQASSTTHSHGHHGGSTSSQGEHGKTSSPPSTTGAHTGGATAHGGGKQSHPSKGGASGKSGRGTTPASKAGSTAVRLVHSAAGVDTYAARSGPLTATVHVAWLSWVRVLSDGKLSFLHEEPTGFTRTFTGKTSLDVYLGFPLDSTVTVNGTRLGPFAAKSTLWVDVGTGG